MNHRRKLDKFIDETRARQRNIAFPDTLRNGRAVDVFLFKGSPNPPLVQRIAAWILGLLFIGIGLSLFEYLKVSDAEGGVAYALAMLFCLLWVLGG
jgi:hypothetical protein